MKTRVILGFLLSTVGPAAAGGLAADIYGHWETDTANCNNLQADAGSQVVIEAGAGLYVKLDYVNHATEGGSCLLRPSSAGDVLELSGQCRWEEGPNEKQGFLSALDDENLTLVSDWLDGTPSPLGNQITFHRCRGYTGGGN